MFSRFTASARRVMQRAFREAKRRQHDFVGTEHLLYGLCYDPEGPAVQLLHTLDAKPETMLEKVELSLQRHDAGVAMEQFPLSPASKRVFQSAASEAASFNHQMIGPEHLLLGLLRERDCEAAQMLAGHGITFAMVHGAVAQIPPDAYHDAKVRAEEQPRFTPSDNPTADELEQWIAPPITQDTLMPDVPYQVPVPASEVTKLEAHIRRTQIFLGAFGGYAVGHWLAGYWPAGIGLGMLGVVLAFFHRAWISIPICGIVALVIAERRPRPWLNPVNPFDLIVALPIGLLFGTFLCDFWRFSLLQPTSAPDLPQAPSGIGVTAETLLEPGSIVFLKAQGRWWRGVVIALEGSENVRVRYPGAAGNWEETVPRRELQLPPAGG